MKVASQVPFSKLTGYSEIFTDLLEHPAKVAALFSWDFRREDDWKKVRDLRRPPHRQALAQLLMEQNAGFGASEESIEAARAIADPSTCVVTTGQQLSIYGGCLFYFYKTITAMRLARRLSDSLGVRVVPVFWMEGEDHDGAEVDHIYMPGEKLERVQVEGIDADRRPVGGRKLPENIGDFHGRVAELLPQTEFSQRVLERLSSAYRPGQTWSSAFGCLWAQLFPGLVLLNPSDPRIKSLAAPVFRREIEGAREIGELIARRDEEVSALGYDLQVKTGYPNFFWLDDGERRNVRHQNGRFQLADGGEDITESLSQFERFSPKVLLRPVVQDYLLPNLATIAGPGEVAYFAQAEALFAAHGVAPSILYPRAAATVLERAGARLLDKDGLPFEALALGPAAVFDKVKSEHPEESQFADAIARIDSLATGLTTIAARMDPTLTNAVATAKEKIDYQLAHLRSKFTRSRYQREEVLVKRIEAACSLCFPLSLPQERVVAGIYYLAKFGPGFLEDLYNTLEIGIGTHQVLAVD